MSKHYQLEAKERKRSGKKKIKELRSEGKIPAVFYGKGIDSENISINTESFQQILKASASANFLVDIKRDGGKATLALVQEVQKHPVTGNILHADFHAVQENEILIASVPLVGIGSPAGVKTGGVLDQSIYDIEIKCLPRDLPDSIQVNIEGLEIGDSIGTHEIDYPNGIESTSEHNNIAFIVSEPRVEAEPVEEEEEQAEPEAIMQSDEVED